VLAGTTPTRIENLTKINLDPRARLRKESYSFGARIPRQAKSAQTGLARLGTADGPKSFFTTSAIRLRWVKQRCVSASAQTVALSVGTLSAYSR